LVVAQHLGKISAHCARHVARNIADEILSWLMFPAATADDTRVLAEEKTAEER